LRCLVLDSNQQNAYFKTRPRLRRKQVLPLAGWDRPHPSDYGRPNFNVRFYAVNKKGGFGSASIWSGGSFAVNTGENQAFLRSLRLCAMRFMLRLESVFGNCRLRISWPNVLIVRGHHGPHPPDKEGSEPDENVECRFHLGHHEIRKYSEHCGGDDRGDDGSLYSLRV